jgi:pimeloyl-ACP methyl ester carboxylesterase
VFNYYFLEKKMKNKITLVVASVCLSLTSQLFSLGASLDYTRVLKYIDTKSECANSDNSYNPSCVNNSLCNDRTCQPVCPMPNQLIAEPCCLDCASKEQMNRACDAKPCACTGQHFEPVTIRHGKVTVAIDNDGNPVEMAYTIAGKIKPGRPVFLCSDTFLGAKGMEWFQVYLSKRENNGSCKFTVIAVDSIGFGLSSKQTPTALDGVEGEIGYSNEQQAIFTHTFLVQLNISEPISWFAVDAQGSVAVKYAVRYANDPLRLDKLVTLIASIQPIVSDNPCHLAFLTTAQAAILSAAFAADPCTIACALLGGDISNTGCPNYFKKIIQESANYFSSLNPKIFERLFLGTFIEDLTPLIPQINASGVKILYICGVNNNFTARRIATTWFSGYCPTCSLNPNIPGVCPCGTSDVPPINNLVLKTYNNQTYDHASFAIWLFFRPVSTDILDFLTDADLLCCPSPVPFHYPTDCTNTCN